MGIPKAELQHLATTVAIAQGLDPALVCALIATESSWNLTATRYEPAFFHRYIENMKGLTAEEKRLRATSLGLMQVMGQVAREQGFDGASLEELFEPLPNLKQGCKKLARCLKQKKGDVHAALLCYNGGGDLNYPQRVMKHYDGTNI